jgi:hypothetical protein
MINATCIRTVIFGAAWALLVPWAQAEVRTFTDSAGRALRGEVVSVSGGSVTIRREDGQTFTVQSAVFSAADQAYIQQQANKPATPSATEKKSAAKITPKDVTELPFCSTMKEKKLDPKQKGMFDELKVTVSERIRIHGTKKKDSSRIGDQVGYHLGKAALFPPAERAGTLTTKFPTEKSSRRQFMLIEYADKLDYLEFEQPADSAYKWTITHLAGQMSLALKDGARDVCALKGDLSQIKGVGFAVTLRWIDTEADTVINFDP